MSRIVAERLIALREKHGLSQSELARRVGGTQSSINRLEAGETGNPRNLLAIARELQTTPEYLTGERDDPAPKQPADQQPDFHGSRSEHHLEMVYVAEIDLHFGLGAAVMDQVVMDHQAELLPFSRAWLRRITSSAPEELYWARARGNSMEPSIGDGDVVLIDRSQTDGLGDLYWAIAYGQNGMIKRLRPMPDGSVKILSDNQSVGPEIAYDGELTIFGRVVAVVKRI